MIPPLDPCAAPPPRHDGEEPPQVLVPYHAHRPDREKPRHIKSTAALNIAAINLVAADAADVVGKVRRIKRRIKTRVVFEEVMIQQYFEMCDSYQR